MGDKLSIIDTYLMLDQKKS